MIVRMAEPRILAEPLDGRTCRFLVDRPLLPGRWAYFAGPDEARGSDLAERLFALDAVESVVIAHDTLFVNRRHAGRPWVDRLLRSLGETNAGAGDWSTLGRRVGGAVRAHLASGRPAVADEVLARMPSSSALKGRVARLFDDEINPIAAGHGGRIELIDVIDNVVYLRMWGGCQGCGLADTTLSVHVRGRIREAVPEIGQIIDLTDHGAGRAPYRRRSHGA